MVNATSVKPPSAANSDSGRATFGSRSRASVNSAYAHTLISQQVAVNFFYQYPHKQLRGVMQPSAGRPAPDHLRRRWRPGEPTPSLPAVREWKQPLYCAQPGPGPALFLAHPPVLRYYNTKKSFVKRKNCTRNEHVLQSLLRSNTRLCTLCQLDLRRSRRCIRRSLGLVLPKRKYRQ